MELELSMTATELAGMAQVEIIGGTLGVSDELVDKVAGVPGVQVAAPLLLATVRATSHHGGSPSIHLLGVDVRTDAAVRSYGGGIVSGHSLPLGLGDDGMLISEVLAERLNIGRGDVLSVRFFGRSRKMIVQGILAPQGIATAYGGEMGVMELKTLQTALGRQGWVDRIDVVPLPGTSQRQVSDAIRATVADRGTVCRTTGPNAWVENALLMLRIIVWSLVGIASLVASLVSYSALSWFVDRITPELALLNAAGLEPQRLRRLLYIDAGLLAVLGTGVGVVCGRILSQSFLGGLSWLSMFIQGTEIQHLTLRASTLATAAVVGGSVTIAGVVGPARRAGRLFALNALLEVEGSPPASPTRRRKRTVRIGLIVVAALGAMFTAAPLLLRVGAILMAGFIAFVAATDFIFPLVLINIRRALDLILPGIGRIIGTGIATRPSRTVVTIACVGAVTAGITLTLTLTHTTARTLDTWLARQFKGGVFVTTNHIFSTQPSELILPETVVAIQKTRDVDAVFEEVSEKIIYQGEEALLVAGSMDVLRQHGELQVVGGDPRGVAEALSSGQVAVSEGFARHFGTRVGDFVTLSTPKGPCQFRVAGIIRDYAGPAGSINIDIRVFDRLWRRQGARDLVFWTDADPATVIVRIRSRLAEQQALLFSYGDSLGHFVTDQTSQLSGVLASIALMTALLGAVAVCSLMLGSVTTEARDRALLVAAGATKTQVRLVILVEGLLLGIGGGLAGVALGISASYIIVTKVLPGAIGWTLSVSLDSAQLTLLLVSVAVSSALASAYPAWMAGDISPRVLSTE
jgi:putative ABC transport system permease protein